MREKPAKGDLVIARVAGRHHGVVSTAQLRSAGINYEGIRRRVAAGRLHRVHRGVYAVGHRRLTFEGRCMAAVLALGKGAAVSHRSAAALWRMLPAHDGPIEVTVPGDGGRDKRNGLRVHRSSTLIAGVSILRDGIRLTKAARTLQDLHRSASNSTYQRAVRRALDLKLVKSRDLQREPDLTRSELERILRSICSRHRLPQPEVNARVGPYEVDFLWREHRLIVETDGFEHHGHRDAFERDRARDARLQSQGFRVLRFTYRQVTDSSTDVAASLHGLLGQKSLTPNL
jgi:very-short-patch-repair endonuclease